MSKHIDLMEPIFFTPPNQPTHPVGGRKLFKGGGSSGQREATAEEKRLWNAQAQSLESMNTIAMPNLATGMNNLGVMTNEAMDGTLAQRLRGMAGADASQATGQSLAAVTRNLDRYGSTLNPNALGAQMSNAALQGAATKANAMNQANIAAEDTKWNRNAALTSLASGQGAQAVNGMGSLAGQITSNRLNANNMDMQAQQNQGNAVAGMMMGGKMMGLYKDGGRVKKRNEPRFAGGGMARFTPVSMPKIAPFSFNADDKAPAADGGMMQTVAGASVPMMGTRMMANGLDKVGISAPKQAIDGLVGAGKNAITDAVGATQFGAPAPVVDAAVSPVVDGVVQNTASTVASNGVPAIGELGALAGESLTAGATGTAATATGTAATATGTAAAGAAGGLGAAAMAAAPWLIGGYALGAMLDLWADGGKVRKDMTKGGAVSGPGTGTSDSVPARLSDGEGVVNTRAMGMSKAETQKVVEDWQKSGGGADDLVLAINDRGLEMRHGKAKAKANPRYEGGNQKMALGGLALALGNGLYKAAPMLNQMDQQKKADERWERQDARTAQMHGVMMEDRADKKAKEAKVAEIMGNWSGRMRQMGEAAQALQTGQLSSHDFAAAVGPEYSRLIQDGKTLQPLADGSFALTEGSGPRANMTKLSADDAAKYLASPEMFMKARRQLYEELAAVDPAYAAKADAMLGQELDAQRDARNFKRLERRDAVADNQFDARMQQGDKHHAASMGLNWANFNLNKGEREYARNKASEAAAAGVAYAKEVYGDKATPALLEAVRTGVIPAVPKDGGYKTEFNEVASALGTPAVDDKGKPITDMMTGRQVINRNPDAEAAFFKWAQSRGYKDTNKAIPIYLAEKASAGAAKPASEKDAHDQASAAIKAGANREAVNARLKQWGFAEIK